MRNGWWATFALAFFVTSAGCADEGSSGEDDPSATGTDATHPADQMVNATGSPEVEMYTVATDLSSTPQTWFRFRPEAFEAKVGDTLNVTLKAAVGNQYAHSLVIDSLQLRLGPLAAGAQASKSLVLGQPGTYTFYCAEGNHAQLGMTGTLTVS